MGAQWGNVHLVRKKERRCASHGTGCTLNRIGKRLQKIGVGEYFDGYVCYTVKDATSALHEGLPVKILVRDAFGRKYRKAEWINHRLASDLAASSLVEVVGASGGDDSR